MISYCGLECESCSIHLATLEQDKSRQREMRIEIAEICNTKYKMHLQPGDVNDCDGCTVNNGRLFTGCLSCEIRACVMERNFKNCAYCPDYACNKLWKIHTEEPESRERLNKIRSSFRM